MHKLFCSNLIAILIGMVKSRLALKFAAVKKKDKQQPYCSYTAVCTGDLFFFFFFFFFFIRVSVRNQAKMLIWKNSNNFQVFINLYIACLSTKSYLCN